MGNLAGNTNSKGGYIGSYLILNFTLVILAIFVTIINIFFFE
jgi:hypothetical protein